MRNRVRIEDRLIVLCTKLQHTDSDREALDSILSEGLDWDYIIKTGLANRVLIPVADRIEAWPDTDEALKRRLRDHTTPIRQRMRRRVAQFEKALPAIVTYNKIILLRGIAYAYTIYKNQIMRDMSDVDVLIDRPTTLSLSGTFLDHHHVPAEVLELYDDGPKALEYHQDLNHSSLGSGLVKMNLAEIWGRAHSGNVQGQTVRFLTPEDNLLYLSFHNIAKGFVKLYRFYDMLVLIDYYAIDWEAVIERSRRDGVSRAVWINCCVLNTVWGDVVPMKVIRALEPSLLMRKLVGYLLDFETIIHDPNPKLGNQYSSQVRNAKKQALCVLLVVRMSNLHKIAGRHLVTNPLIWLYDTTFRIPLLGTFVGALRRRLQVIGLRRQPQQ